jgi:tetratricopeptide (TPR) repeat protein
MKQQQESPGHRFESSLLNFLCAVIFTITLMLGGMPAHGQKRAPVMMPQTQPPVPATPSTLNEAELVLGAKNPVGSNASGGSQDSTCFLPPLTGMHTATVEVADLQVPAKAQKEYDDGCAALKNKKMADAETHLRKVVKEYAKYAAAWVLLGQVLEARQKTNEARDACSNALTSAANYLPAYLCLTDISARASNWDEVLKLSTRALEIDPVSNAAAYAYNATAALNLHHLADAEKSALRASEIDSKHSEPRLLYLLAQIYAAKGDRANLTAQLREYLKFTRDPEDAVAVRNYLAKLEGQTGQTSK